MTSKQEKLNQLNRLLNNSSKQLKELLKLKLQAQEHLLNASTRIDGYKRELEDGTISEFTRERTLLALEGFTEREVKFKSKVERLNKEINDLLNSIRIQYLAS